MQVSPRGRTEPQLLSPFKDFPRITMSRTSSRNTRFSTTSAALPNARDTDTSAKTSRVALSNITNTKRKKSDGTVAGMLSTKRRHDDDVPDGTSMTSVSPTLTASPSADTSKLQHNFTPKRATRGSRSKLIIAAIASRSNTKDEIPADGVQPVAITSYRYPSKAITVATCERSNSEEDTSMASLNIKELRVVAASKRKKTKGKAKSEDTCVIEDGVIASTSGLCSSRRETTTSQKDLQEEHNTPGVHSKKKHVSWTPGEDAKLNKLVGESGSVSEISWRDIAPFMEGRTCKQCRERWHNHLRPNVVKGNWEEWEDRTIFDLQRKLGNKWAKIREQIPHRTDNDIKNRWHSFVRSQKRRQERVDGAKKIRQRAKQDPSCNVFPFLVLPTVETPKNDLQRDEDKTHSQRVSQAISGEQLTDLMFEQLPDFSPDSCVPDAKAMAVANRVAGDVKRVIENDALRMWMEDNDVRTPGLSCDSKSLGEQSHMPSGSFSNYKWTPSSASVSDVVVVPQALQGERTGSDRVERVPLRYL